MIITNKIINNFIFLFINKKIPEPMSSAIDVCLRYTVTIAVKKLVK